MASVAVLSLMRTLELEFFQPHPRPILQEKELISCNKDLLQSLHRKLGFLMELFDENRMDGVEAIKNLETKLRNVAFRIEDEIELHVVHLYVERPKGNTGEKSTHHCQRLRQILHPVTGKSHPCLKFRRILQRAKEDIDAIEEELVKVKMEYNHFIALQGRKTTLDATPKFDELVKMDSSSKHASHSEDIMVGKNNEFETIREMLIEHPAKQREVVLIQGMGGIGKTTLARRVYEDPSIASHFDKRAWVVASQHHNKRQMLEGLLNSIGNAGMLEGLLNSIGNAGSGSDEDLAIRLYQGLKGLRYLVVMDDVWSGEAWDAIKVCFPDDINGSRVLLTTRLAKVANHTCSEDGFSHQMDLLEQSESWNLFYEKACKSRGAEFEKIGRPIVDKCKGLPLAIVVVAGLFSKLNTLDEWKNTANALSSSSASTLDDEECSRILSLSYNHLPHNLKACFLYLGVFPEDHEIKANDLARLWFAEGLVKAFENESFDAVANRYIQELMDRNLITLSKPSSCGRKIKWFRMHDLLHAFCVREAQNENLLHVVRENSSNFSQKGFRWVSIQSKDFDTPKILSLSKSCRSFFYFLREVSILNFKNFNLLRVLYSIGPFMLEKIVYIVLLRFLNPMSRKNMELSRAWNLQTLDLKSSSMDDDFGGKYSEFPQLQYILCRSFLGNPPKFVHKLSWIRADYCSKEYITNIPYLKKVCIFFGQSKDCNDWIVNLAYLEQLEGLRIYGDGKQTAINNHILLLENLRKLSFFCIRFEWEEINVLSKLPRLEVLKLGWMSCVGEEWKIPEEVIFSQLICLYIYESDPKHWKASSHNFPKLERLLLYFCHKSREIPIGFAEISTLKSIKLWECIPSLVESAKKIQDEQHDYGNYNMVVIEEDTLKASEFEESLSEEEIEVDN